MTLFVKFEGLSEVTGTLRRIPANLERLVIGDLSQVAFDVAQRGADRHHKTGALRQSLFNRAIPNGREVGHDPQRAPHAIFVQLGTRPHEIRPKAGGSSSNTSDFGPVRTGERKALRWAVGGRYIFAKVVKHPGYRGDAYLIEAATAALRDFERIVDKRLKEQT
jgi:hypothetical protein